MQELNILKAGTVGNVRVIDNAAVQIKPVKPKKSLVVVIATLLGGMLSVALVLVRAAFNRGIEGPEELEKLGMNVYASVPLSEWQDVRSKTRKNIIDTTKRHCLHSTTLLTCRSKLYVVCAPVCILP